VRTIMTKRNYRFGSKANGFRNGFGIWKWYKRNG